MNTRPSPTSPTSAPRAAKATGSTPRAAKAAAPVPRTAALHDAAGLAVVAPCHLGRPVNLLPLFTAGLREDLAELFRGGMNRRYRASFEIGEVTIGCAAAPEHGGRWWGFASPVGRIEFALDRAVVLAALNYRYGASSIASPSSPSTSSAAEEDGEHASGGDADGPPAGAAAADVAATSSTNAGVSNGAASNAAVSNGALDAPARETATEERLAAMLGLQLTHALVARVDAWLGEQAEPPALAPGIACAPPPAGTWTVRVAITEGGLGMAGRLWFALDAGWMERLLRHLVVARAKPKDLSGGKPLATRLQLQVCGRLLHKEMPLGRLIDLRVGDVIPVSLGATDVLVDDSRLFRAIVAERSGKLCLTSFEDVE
jgi:flagellar motor switch protein FliM